MAGEKTATVELKNVDTYSPPAKGEPPLVYRDKIAKGLRFVVYPSGKKTFLYFYRNPQGVQRKWTMGSFPSTTLTKARAKVADLKDVLERAKKDPALAQSPKLTLPQQNRAPNGKSGPRLLTTTSTPR